VNTPTLGIRRRSPLALPFRSPLPPQIREIEFTEFNNGMDPESNPSKIHLYVNRENLGFEDCDDVDPTQTLHLTTEDMRRPIQLKYVKYQRVKSLTLFIEDNQGGDVTALGGIKLFGFPVTGTNMTEFKKQQQL
jgi:PITH domain